MSSNPPTSPDPGDLQFDRVEYATGSAGPTSVCTACRQPLSELYYEVSGKIFCARCKEAIQAQLTGGSRSGRLSRALLFGGITALVGSVLYYAVRTVVGNLTGMEFGIFAIVLGWMIGAAVRRGASMRGGVLYQFLAAAMTYVSISYSYLPMVTDTVKEKLKNPSGDIRNGLMGKDKDEKSKLSAADSELLRVATEGQQELRDDDPALSGAQLLRFTTGTAIIPPAHSSLARLTLTTDSKIVRERTGIDVETSATANEPRKRLPQPIRLALLAIVTLVFALAIPVFMALNGPILGLIYLFAMWQAWRMNGRPHVVITGPYYLKPGASGAASHPPPLP